MRGDWARRLSIPRPLKNAQASHLLSGHDHFSGHVLGCLKSLFWLETANEPGHAKTRRAPIHPSIRIYCWTSDPRLSSGANVPRGTLSSGNARDRRQPIGSCPVTGRQRDWPRRRGDTETDAEKPRQTCGEAHVAPLEPATPEKSPSNCVCILFEYTYVEQANVAPFIESATFRDIAAPAFPTSDLLRVRLRVSVPPRPIPG
jgi:hypothetical protein